MTGSLGGFVSVDEVLIGRGAVIKHNLRGGRTLDREVDSVRLETVSEIAQEPIERDGEKREVVSQELSNGCRLVTRRAHLFDSRGVKLELYNSHGDRPFMSAEVFTTHRFRELVSWFSYLARRPDAMRSEGRLERLVRDYNSALVGWKGERLR